MVELLDEENKTQEDPLTSKEVEETTVVGELERTELSQTESKPNIIMTIGDGSPQPGHNMTVMAAGLTSASNAGQHAPSPRVKVVIKYPGTWKKEKHFKDGDTREIAPETAAQFVQLGFAIIVAPEKPE